MTWAFWAGVITAAVLAEHGAVAAAAGCLVFAVVLFAHSRVFPFAKCLRCGGSPRTYDGGTWRECGSCRGSGKRRRVLAGPS